MIFIDAVAHVARMHVGMSKYMLQSRSRVCVCVCACACVCVHECTAGHRKVAAANLCMHQHAPRMSLCLWLANACVMHAGIFELCLWLANACVLHAGIFET